jgi:neutral/alkaline ceramidase-like enzyme
MNQGKKRKDPMMPARITDRKRMVITGIAAAMVLVLSGAPALAELRAGAGSADITPDPSRMRVTIGGYGKFLGHRATGVHDPVAAKAVVFESAGTRAALVSIDLVEVSREVREAVLDRLAGTAYSSENIFICATHTHAAPGAVENHLLAALAFGPYSQRVVDVVADGIVKAIKDADRGLRSVRLRIAQARAPGLTRNRGVPFYNYHTRRFSRPYNPKAEPPADDTITVLRADDKAGRPVAIIVSFAAHATALGPDNSLLSADWPGVLRRDIEERYPGTVMVYVNGAEGDQAPDEADIPDDYKAMDIFGMRVAQAAAPLIERARPVHAEPLSYKIEWLDVDAPAQFGGIRIPAFAVRCLIRKMPLSAIRLGDIILLGAPVEATGTVGLAIKEAARSHGYSHPIYIGLMNQYCGYVTSPEEFRAGGYEARFTLFGEAEAGMIGGALSRLAQELKNAPVKKARAL